MVIWKVAEEMKVVVCVECVGAELLELSQLCRAHHGGVPRFGRVSMVNVLVQRECLR